MTETRTFGHAAVAAPHFLAAEAGRDILIEGGNAIEAIVAMAAVIAPIWHGVLAQLRDWTHDDRFRSVNKQTDYRDRVKALRVPHLVVGGSADGIAPPPVCRQHFGIVGSPDKELLLMGRDVGHADYGHGDLLLGAHAHEEL